MNTTISSERERVSSGAVLSQVRHRRHEAKLGRQRSCQTRETHIPVTQPHLPSPRQQPRVCTNQQLSRHFRFKNNSRGGEGGAQAGARGGTGQAGLVITPPVSLQRRRVYNMQKHVVQEHQAEPNRRRGRAHEARHDGSR